METALTCRALSNFLQEKILEEASLGAILNSLDRINRADAQLLIRELPLLLSLKYPIVKEIRAVALQVISQLMEMAKSEGDWQDFVELDYISGFLEERFI